jgi:hypothetical protein
MYPSFNSSQHREEKRAELLDRAQRRIRQANIKRDMYAETMWASDEGRYAKVNPNSKVDASTQAGEPDIKPSKGDSQTSLLNKPPVMKDVTV